MRATLRYLLLLTLFVAGLASAEPKFPALSGRVVDTAGLLDAGAAQQLEAQLAAFEQASSIQLVVVTLPDLQGYEIEEFGYQLGRFWGIGQKGKNNGVLLIVAQAERKVRIEVGYGLEGTLTDALSANIIQSVIVPQFKSGQFATGIEQGAAAVMAALKGEYQPQAQRGNSQQQTRGGLLIFFLMFMGVIFLRSFGGGGPGGFGRGGGLFLPGGFGGGGGFGSGGGGFSGGGGGFGGGGASGNW